MCVLISLFKFVIISLFIILLVVSKIRDTINDAITMFGSDNVRPDLLVIVSDRDANNDLQDALDDVVVSVIVGISTYACFNPDSSKIACLVDNKDKQLIYEPDAASIQMCDFECPNGSTSEFNQHTRCSMSYEQKSSTIHPLIFTRRLQ